MKENVEIGEETGPGSAPKADPPCAYCKPLTGGVKGLLSFSGFVLLHRFAKPVALAVHIEDMAVVRQAIQQGRRHSLALKDLNPFAERQIAGDQKAGSLIPVGKDLEQQLRSRTAEG